LPALAGRRVRQRLTPTMRGSRITVMPLSPTGDGVSRRRGARRCLARRAVGAGTRIGMHGGARFWCGTPVDGWRGGDLPSRGPAGQAAPDPYRTGPSPNCGRRPPHRGRVVPGGGDTVRCPCTPDSRRSSAAPSPAPCRRGKLLSVTADRGADEKVRTTVPPSSFSGEHPGSRNRPRLLA